jgi:hypothetical protein
MADCTGRRHFLTLSDAPVIAGSGWSRAKRAFRAIPAPNRTGATSTWPDCSASASLLPLLRALMRHPRRTLPGEKNAWTGLR